MMFIILFIKKTVKKSKFNIQDCKIFLISNPQKIKKTFLT